MRGGRFVGGPAGEQFALPEAVEALRAVRREPFANELVVISAADPLNLVGFLIPGPRVAAHARNRLAFLDGLPVAKREDGRIEPLSGADEVPAELVRSLSRMT